MATMPIARLQRILEINRGWIDQQCNLNKMSALGEENAISDLAQIEAEITIRNAIKGETIMAKKKKKASKKSVAAPAPRKRRSAANVENDIKKIKEMIFNGVSVIDACKQVKMQPQIYYKHKDKVFSETTPATPENVERGGLKQFTRDQILEALNAPVDVASAKIVELEKQISKMLELRDATIKALGL